MYSILVLWNAWKALSLQREGFNLALNRNHQ